MNKYLEVEQEAAVPGGARLDRHPRQVLQERRKGFDFDERVDSPHALQEVGGEVREILKRLLHHRNEHFPKNGIAEILSLGHTFSANVVPKEAGQILQNLKIYLEFIAKIYNL